jgi:hypothetical protein
MDNVKNSVTVLLHHYHKFINLTEHVEMHSSIPLEGSFCVQFADGGITLKVAHAGLLYNSHISCTFIAHLIKLYVAKPIRLNDGMISE